MRLWRLGIGVLLPPAARAAPAPTDRGSHRRRATSSVALRSPDEGARLGAAMKVERHGGAHEADADQLEQVPEPPAEVHVAPDERRHERHRQQHRAEHHEQVGSAAREQVRWRARAQAERSVEDEAEREHDHRRGAARLRHARNDRGREDPGGAKAGHEHEQRALEPEQSTHALSAA